LNKFDGAHGPHGRLQLGRAGPILGYWRDDIHRYDAFSSVAGELRYQFQNGNTFVEGDMDGNGQVDLALELNGEVTLVSGDFVLS
jgi:hypothetical protein